MKRYLFILLVLATVSCKNKDNEVSVKTQTGTITKSAVKTSYPNKNTAFEGIYSGRLPCEYCKDKGLLTKLSIFKDSTYILLLQELGNEDTPRIFKGTYSLKKSDIIITLDADGDHLKFKLMEGMIKKVDKFGNDEQGSPASRYLLHKTQ